jgi:hypothetical protein
VARAQARQSGCRTESTSGRGLPPYRATGDETKLPWGACTSPESTSPRKEPHHDYLRANQGHSPRGWRICQGPDRLGPPERSVLLRLYRPGRERPVVCRPVAAACPEPVEGFGYSDGVHLRRIHRGVFDTPYRAAATRAPEAGAVPECQATNWPSLCNQEAPESPGASFFLPPIGGKGSEMRGYRRDE